MKRNSVRGPKPGNVCGRSEVEDVRTVTQYDYVYKERLLQQLKERHKVG
jgi:hypothetical protein